MEEIREIITAEDMPQAPAPAPKKKIKRTPAKPTRTPDDLNEVAPKKMTDKEKDIYIEHLRDKVACAETYTEQLKDICESSYERAREAEERAKKVSEQANLKLNLLRDNVSVMANNVMTILEK